MFESTHKPDDDQSSDDEILHPFEPNIFQSIHKPDDDQSSDNEILHHLSQALCMSLMIVMMRKLFMSLKAESSRVVVTLIVHLQVVVKIIC